MPVSVAEILRRWRSIDIIEESKEAIGETSDDIIHLNQEQLLSGEGSDGKNLPTKLKPYPWGETTYDVFKIGMNPNAEGRYDMRLSGDSFSSMALKIEGDKFTIHSDGWMQKYEAPGLHDLSGHPGLIFGLNNDNKQAYRNNVLLPRLVRRIAQITGAKTNTQ